MTPTAADYDRAVIVADRCAKLERAVIVALLRSRRRGMAAARTAGITIADFDQPDLAALFLVIEATADRPLIITLRIARGLLTSLNYFDDRVPRGSRGMHWSCATLCEAAVCTGFDADFAAASLPALFNELKQFIVAQRQAEAA